MASSVSSNASTAWQTALSSARSSNVNSNVQSNAAGSSSSNVNGGGPRSSYATMARLAEAGGYGSSNHYNPTPAPRPSSSASSSSSFTSSHGLADDSSSASGERNSYSQQPFRNNASHTPCIRQSYSASGWRGSVNVQDPNPRSSAYATAGSPSSSRASSAAPSPPSNYANTTLARTSSQSGLSTSGSEHNGYSSRSHRGGHLSSSRSQTSIDSEGALQIAAQQTAVIREIARPVVNNFSEWEDAFRSVNTDKRKKAKDEEELAAGIEALGLNPDLTERKQPTRHTPNLPPPPSSGAWTFKNTISIPRGMTVEPGRLGNLTPEYLKIANQASEVLSPHSIIGKRPKLLVLDLNQTLVTRRKATSQGARNATPRPYLSAFLEYVCGSDEISEGVFQRRFNVMIWSSAEAANVETMCETLCLFTNGGTQAPLLVDLWDRGSMDITLEQLNSKYPTIKDLTKVWRILKWDPVDPASPNPALLQRQDPANHGHSSSASVSSSRSSNNGDVYQPSPSPAPSMASSTSTSTTATYSKKDLRWSQLDTILIDDTPTKASIQPHNHLSIPSWKPPNKIGIPSSNGRDSYNNGGMMGPGETRNDTRLVQLVGMLERLRYHTNVSAAIRSSQFDGLGRDQRGDTWANFGFQVLKAKGIKPVNDFDSRWAIRVFGKNTSTTPNVAGLFTSNMNSRPPSATPSVQVGWD